MLSSLAQPLCVAENQYFYGKEKVIINIQTIQRISLRKMAIQRDFDKMLGVVEKFSDNVASFKAIRACSYNRMSSMFKASHNKSLKLTSLCSAA